MQVGTPLITFDPEVIGAAGYELTTPVVITNAKTFGDPIMVAPAQVTAGAGLFILPASPTAECSGSH